MARKTHPGCIDRNGRCWRVRLSVAGTRHTYQLDERVTLKQAREYARTKHAELTEQAKRTAVGLPGTTPVETLLERYETERLPMKAKRTAKAYTDSLTLFRAYLKAQKLTLPVHEVRPAHISGFLSWARVNPQSKGRKTVSGRTLQRHRAAISGVFRWAMKDLGLIDSNPVAATTAPTFDGRESVILSDDEYEALITAAEDADPMLGCYTLLLGETGLRSGSEALWLTWEDLDLSEGFLHVQSGRGATGRRRGSPGTCRSPHGFESG